jgi:predicted nucleic-acid-binding protein
MIAVDTNVLVRFFTVDEPAQAARAARLVRRSPIWVSKTVLLETEWVLRGLYKLPAESILAAIEALAGLPNVQFEDAANVARAIRWSASGMDFADALHLASRGDADKFATFDRKFSRHAGKLTGVEVVPV